jgi:hypothetical protein
MHQGNTKQGVMPGQTDCRGQNNAKIRQLSAVFGTNSYTSGCTLTIKKEWW